MSVLEGEYFIAVGYKWKDFDSCWETKQFENLQNVSKFLTQIFCFSSFSVLTHSPVKTPPDIAMATVKSPPDVAMATVKVEESHEVPMTSSNTEPDITMDSSKMLSHTPPDISMVPVPKSPQNSRTVEMATSPFPRRIADSELRVLEDCLHRWRTEVESDVRGIDVLF